MDINTITEVVRQPPDPPGAHWRAGDAFLAGGTWLFSDQQPELRRLIDLMPLGWGSVTASDAGLEIGAMCTIRELYAFSARRLVGRPADHHQLRDVPGLVSTATIDSYCPRTLVIGC